MSVKCVCVCVCCSGSTMSMLPGAAMVTSRPWLIDWFQLIRLSFSWAALHHGERGKERREASRETPNERNIAINGCLSASLMVPTADGTEWLWHQRWLIGAAIACGVCGHSRPLSSAGNTTSYYNELLSLSLSLSVAGIDYFMCVARMTLDTRDIVWILLCQSG